MSPGKLFHHDDHKKIDIDVDYHIAPVPPMAPMPPMPPLAPETITLEAFQKEIDGVNHIYFKLPGVDKSKIKLRAKPDLIIVDSQIAEEFVDVMGKQVSTLKIKLNNSIIATEVKAKYSDGILKVTAPLSDPGEIIDVSYKDE